MSESIDVIEDEARSALANHDLDLALQLVDQAIAMREDAQGPDDPDLIWSLSIKIEALQWRHSRDDTTKAAILGERRLALRRKVLAHAPDELAFSMKELAQLYVFEDDPIEPARIRELEKEAHSLMSKGA